MSRQSLDASRCGARGKAFLLELEQLCEKHGVGINLGSYEGIDFVLRDLTDESESVIEGHDGVWSELHES